MTETRSINISSKAYYKIMLHCMKHTSSDCYGFLIGNVKDNTYHINEAVPFTHDKIFAPSLEIAVKMISIYMATEGTIVGIYENQMFNQMKDDGTISAQGLTLCELINTKTTKHPVLVEIFSKDNTKDKVLEDDIFVKQYIFNDKGFDLIGDRKESEEEYKTMKDYLLGCYQNDIVDFDDHLLDAKLDWRNTFIK